MRRILPLLILLAVALSACGGSAAPTATVSPTKTPTKAATAPTASATATPAPIPGGCKTVGLMPDPDPAFPPVTAADWSIGPADAKVTIVEYSDFQCPYCAQAAPILKDMEAKFPQDYRFVYRHFPLNIHDKALLSAQAAEAAGLQGKFWEMHDFLFARQADWQDKSPADFTTWIGQQATGLGLDAAKFSQDMVSDVIALKVTGDQAVAVNIGLDHTPTLILNGRLFGGSPDEATLTYLINLFKQVYSIAPKRLDACPAMTIDTTKSYFATLTTTKGNIVMALNAAKAPLAVNSFITLAQKGYYDNTPFHRVIQDFVAQTGDPSGTGLGNPGYNFNNEITDLKFDKAGVVGMANAGPNTNGSQFFIAFGPQPHLDGSFTVFGQVTQGMDVVLKLTVRDPSDPSAPAPDTILKVTIETK